MNHTEYDELYSYLAAFQDSSFESIADYLSDLGQSRFDSFIDGLISVIPEAKFETDSKFNFTVDSTLSGGSFPCRHSRCRENNLIQLARFAVQYSDKVLIRPPISYAFSEHDSVVNIKEFALGIYFIMQLEQVVKAGFVGFSDGIIPLCEDCFADQLRAEERAKKSLRNAWGQLVDDFCHNADCTLVPYEGGGFYVAINGLEAYGSDEEIDVDFVKEPRVYIDALAQRGKTSLSKDEIIQGGLVSLLIPVLSDCYSALVDPVIRSSTYLTTRPAQVELLSKLSNSYQDCAKKPRKQLQVGCSLPFAENASLNSLIDFRKRHEDAFLVFRDRISPEALSALRDEQDANDFRRDVIEPELHKIDLLMKTSRRNLITAVGAEAAIGTAALTIGQYCGFDPATVAGLLGAGGLAQKVLDLATKDKAQNNPMYFLWQLEKRS